MSLAINRLFRPTVLAALAVGGTIAAASTAQANVEIGGTAGVHAFSETNELGVNDVANAPSERNSALFGLRLGVFFGDMIGVEGEFGVIPSESRRLVFDVWNVTYRGHIVAQFRAADDNVKLVPFVLLGASAMQIVDSKGTDKQGSMGKPSDGFTEDYELLLSIYKEFGRKKVEKKEEPPVDDDPDHDGIKGAADKCPNEPEDKDGFQDEDGCPDPDNDGDGVPDAQDKCPDKPETKNGFEDEDGCPDEIPAKLKQFTGVIAGINFKVGDATLLATSNKTLDKAVAVLKEFPDLKMEIQGHTDDQVLKAAPGAKYADNQALSQGRAETVKEYFVSKGIEGGRLTAVGKADTEPVVPPADLKGAALNNARAKNRRVEFKLVSALTGGSPAPTPPSP